MSDEGSAKQSAIGALLASGFPFQTAIAHLVKRVAECQIRHQEFPWPAEGGTRFLDLIVSKGQLDITIECKKTQKDVFTFLQPTIPGTKQGDVFRCRCLRTFQKSGYGLGKSWEIMPHDEKLLPGSPESTFCVVSTSVSGKDQRMLENDAQILVAAADAFGNHLNATAEAVHFGTPRVIIPVIVTNAKLFVARYDPNTVSLDTGQLTSSFPEFSSIGCARFTKAFSYDPTLRERTVFVVAASALESFLTALEILRNPLFED